MQPLSPMLRDRYALPSDPNAVELRALTHGLMPHSVPAMLQHFADDWRLRGVDAWNRVPDHWTGRGLEVGWWTLPEFLGDHFIAPLLSAPAGSCIWQPSVHWSVQCLLSSPEIDERGGQVVMTDAEFPSVRHSVRRWSDQKRWTVDEVPARPDGFVDVERLLAAISGETALVIVSHVGFLTGELLPDHQLRQIADAAHAAGALFVVDGYHAVGSIPIEVEAIGADLYLGGLLKEASGSAGNGLLYIRPGCDLHPQIGGWFGDQEPFAFADRPQPNASIRRRFLGGTTPVAAMYHAVEGVRLLLDAGLEEVRAHSLDLTQQCIDHCDRLGLSLRSPRADQRRGAMLVVEVDEAGRLCEHLKQHAIFTDSRQDEVLRLAPFVWNTREEIERAFEEIEDSLSTGSYRSASPRRAGPVT